MRHMNTDRHRFEHVPIASIRAYAANPRQHPLEQIAMLKSGIQRLGFNAPILLAPDHELIAGHGRLQAARELGMTQVPAVILTDLSADERRAYRIADNAVALKAAWSFELLESEVTALLACDLDIGALDLGFDVGELDFHLSGGKHKRRAVEEPAPPVDRTRPAVTRLGDLWTIGKHRLLCGDSLQRASFIELMKGDVADAVLSDPPFNRAGGDIGGLGRVKHPDFAMAKGEMSRNDFKAFLAASFEQQAAFSRPGALHFQFIDWRSVADMIHVGEEVYDALVNLCVWVKPNGGMGSLWRSRHELVCVFRVTGGKHANYVNLGKHGRNRTNVWEYAAPSGLGPERANLALHPTCKNIDMIGDAIMDCTKRKGVVLDAFVGSGTTLLAAQRTGRWGRGIELDPHYVDVCLRRLEEECGAPAVRQDGEAFASLDHAHRED